MKQFSTILKFELSSYYKSKGFIGLTILLVSVLGLLLFSPRYMPMITGLFEGNQKGEEVSTITEVMFASDIVVDKEYIETLNSMLSSVNVQFIEVDYDVEQMRSAIESQEYERGIYLKDYNHYIEVVGDTSLNDSLSYEFNSIITQMYQIVSLNSQGISNEGIHQIVYPQVTSETIQIGVNQEDNFLYTYIMIFILYMGVIIYGQYVVSSILVEKTSRAMEVLVTSAKPTAFIFAKVLGTTIAALGQITIITCSAYVFYQMNLEAWETNPLISSLFSFPISLIGYMLLFFVLGFVLYSFMFGAAASLASKLEDMSSVVTPVTFLFIIAFMLTIVNLFNGVDSTVMVILSYVPFTSPMAMFTRVAMSDIAMIEVLTSVGILLITIVFIGWLAAKIYRYGVFFYGNKPNLIKIILQILKESKRKKEIQ